MALRNEVIYPPVPSNTMPTNTRSLAGVHPNAPRFPAHCALSGLFDAIVFHRKNAETIVRIRQRRESTGYRSTRPTCLNDMGCPSANQGIWRGFWTEPSLAAAGQPLTARGRTLRGSRYERHWAVCEAPRRSRCPPSIEEGQRGRWPDAAVTRRAQGGSGHRLCRSSVTM